ncbi:DinB family protein [Planococcus lenghuensis]|uniref:DinB-like domain-containing protein n=1 Tax=Planococcus lenghuensis TaxID=2213202 RepID=A0A1Q2KVX9_9BACL|nr:DinB family protein [Planococcus lenghuensis]AQQ52351.1 hypothetical protein B0X71_03980 [Planococcus lenghuensis]
MNFSIEEAIEVLERSPLTFETLLTGLSPGWLHTNEGRDTWNAAQVIDHLAEAERTNWIPRIRTILESGTDQPFPDFDRFAHLKQDPDQPISEKLARFKTLRAQNLVTLKEWIQPDTDLDQTGTHPAFGEVKLRELIATWAVHDLTHIAQIVRVMAEYYRREVGPWEQYLGVLKNSR